MAGSLPPIMSAKSADPIFMVHTGLSWVPAEKVQVLSAITQCQSPPPGPVMTNWKTTVTPWAASALKVAAIRSKTPWTSGNLVWGLPCPLPAVSSVAGVKRSIMAALASGQFLAAFQGVYAVEVGFDVFHRGRIAGLAELNAGPG